MGIILFCGCVSEYTQNNEMPNAPVETTMHSIMTGSITNPNCSSTLFDSVNENDTTDVIEETEDQEESNILYLEPGCFNKLIAEEKNFRVFSAESDKGFYYEILDNNGSVFDEGFCSWKYNGLMYLDENTLCLKYGTGGMGMFAAKYFDLHNRRVSRTFYSPWGAENDLVAYFISKEDQNILVVQDIFDPSGYYKEFYSDSFGLSIYTDRGAVEFDFEKQQITVMYSLYPNYEDTVITFDLR